MDVQELFIRHRAVWKIMPKIYDERSTVAHISRLFV